MNPTYSKQSEIFLDKQPERQIARIKKAINALPNGDIKKLKGGFSLSGKQQLITILDLMGEGEVDQLLQYVKESFRVKPKTWDDVEEDDPTSDEIEAIEGYLASK